VSTVALMTSLFAMHAPDGFLQPSVALVTALISVALLAVALRHAGRELGDRQVPLAGVAAAFIFAAQMVNFPVAAGTTGHLLGGALAAVLLGPWVGMLVVSVVVIVQALLFADGGLTALGYNTLNMAIVTAFGGWATYVVVRKLLPRTSGGVVGAGALAAGVSVVLSAAAFSIEWLFGASAPVAFDTVFGAMVGVHVLIGIGEAVLTGLVLSAVMASRPDLVVGARHLTSNELQAKSRVGMRPFLIGSIVAAVVVGVVISQFAASSPDGLERVAIDKGFAEVATDHALDSSLFSDYATAGVSNEALSLAVAGVAGISVTLLVGGGVLSASRSVRRRQMV